jgi:hypothetical protein
MTDRIKQYHGWGNTRMQTGHSSTLHILSRRYFFFKGQFRWQETGKVTPVWEPLTAITTWHRRLMLLISLWIWIWLAAFHSVIISFSTLRRLRVAAEVLLRPAEEGHTYVLYYNLYCKITVRWTRRSLHADDGFLLLTWYGWALSFIRMKSWPMALAI